VSWIEANLVQLLYWLDIVGQLLPFVLTVAVVFTFFMVQGYARKISRMEFYLDRIDNHLREITYFIKEYRAENGVAEKAGDQTATSSKEKIPAAGRKTQR
jgi:hypothetical protein